MKEIEKQMILDLANEIAKLKENECGNSGANWYDRFKAQYWEILKAEENENLL